MTLVAAEDEKTALTSTSVARLLGMSNRTLLRVPKEDLDYWETPGGGHRRHRRYHRVNVERYARDYLGLDLSSEDDDEQQSRET